MPSFSQIGKTGYIYDEATDTWYPLAGVTDPNQDIDWAGDHNFASSSTITIDGTLISRNGINVFLNTADRNAKIPSPVNGTVALVPVNGVMQVQYYNNGAWRLIGSNAQLQERTADYNLVQTDAGTTIKVNSSSNVNIIIPTDITQAFPIGSQIAFIRMGTGEVSLVPGTSGATTTTILSKSSFKRLAARYSQAIIVKDSANTWIAMGDLKA